MKMEDYLATYEELNQAIDYGSVLEQISGFASFLPAKKAILSALPHNRILKIQQELALAKEAMTYVQAGGFVNMQADADISNDVKEAYKGMTLHPEQFVEILRFLASCRDVHKAFGEENYPLLYDAARSIDPCSRLFEEISDKIDLTGSVKEDATPALRNLHHQQAEFKSQLANKARNFIKHHTDDLMDTTTTTIGGRLCVLMKASMKNRYGGMVHGSSQSGMAYYVEPMELVELNNELQSVGARIEEEKKKICTKLSLEVKNKAKALITNIECLTMIDAAMAKGKWAVKVDGVIPALQTRDSSLVLENARHPLIRADQVVANTYALKNGQLCLMISGPNMGGKTVTLKTIALFTALAHAGFPVSAHRAVIPLFDQMFFDIGDNQSIENNLSTFSAHISRLSRIVEQADEKTFILLDEVGNGTDPQEGSALAQAILEHLLDKKAMILTSTHYNDVKAYGKTDSRILVSSVEFDPSTLKPTYRYLPGISGASYAFQIADQLHMNRQLLQRAQFLKEERQSDVQKQLAALEEQQQRAKEKQDRFDKMIADAHDLQRQAAREKEKWEKQKKRLDDEYQHELNEMLEQSKEEAREILAQIRKANGPVHEQIARMRQLDEMEETTESASPGIRKDWKEGDYVRIEALNNHGQILSVKKNKAQILVNGKKITVSTDQLTPMVRPKTEKKVKKQHKDRSFAAFPLELNIIGMRVEEGINTLDHYLDQAVYHRVKNVRIIHGMGTGALRNAVWDDLRKQNSVKTFSSAGPSDGGLGATLVELK